MKRISISDVRQSTVARQKLQEINDGQAARRCYHTTRRWHVILLLVHVFRFNATTAM